MTPLYNYISVIMFTDLSAPVRTHRIGLFCVLCSFNRLSNRVVQPVWQPAVYMMQPVVKPVVIRVRQPGWMFVYTIQPVGKPVWQPVVTCIQTFTRLSNGF